MKKSTVIWAGVAAVATLPLFLYLRPTMPKGAKPVSPFDKDKYLGTWYEMARLDYFFERNLINVTANYSIGNNGTIKVINRGFDVRLNIWKESIGKAKFAGDPSSAALKVSFFGPIYAGYNVIALDTYYKYALVAGRNLDYLWILSREKTIPEPVRLSYVEEAAKLGYNVSKLVWVKHDSTGDIR
jgi:apolipoprotein D and lipocalin family protein